MVCVPVTAFCCRLILSFPPGMRSFPGLIAFAGGLSVCGNRLPLAAGSLFSGFCRFCRCVAFVSSKSETSSFPILWSMPRRQCDLFHFSLLHLPLSLFLIFFFFSCPKGLYRSDEVCAACFWQGFSRALTSAAPHPYPRDRPQPRCVFTSFFMPTRAIFFAASFPFVFF